MTASSHLGLWQLIGLRVVLAAAAATLGAAIAVSFKKISHLGLCLLISFAAGALLAVAIFDILPETFALVGPLKGSISILSGYLLFFLITRFVFHICPACSATHTEVNFKAITAAMIVALSVHSFMDGLAIYAGTRTGSDLGFLILFAVVFHKVPEGMALSLVALGSGMARRRAFFMTFALEAITTLSGGLVGLLFFIPRESVWLGYILGHVGGGFIFLVVHALLSEVVKHHPRYTLLSAFCGALTIGIVGFLIGAF